MARPRVPLISKCKALEVALHIVDAEGIEALSIRRLAEELGVNGASLYHHFTNKEEILTGVAMLALEHVSTPRRDDEPWRAWLLCNAMSLRRALCAHPDLLPIMLRRRPLGIGAAELDSTVAHLEQEHVPTGAIAPMLEALELLAISSALRETQAGAGGTTGTEDAPNATRAIQWRAVSADAVFRTVCEKVIDTVIITVLEQGDQPPPAPRATSELGKPVEPDAVPEPCRDVDQPIDRGIGQGANASAVRF